MNMRGVGFGIDIEANIHSRWTISLHLWAA
jgi:hypothetical protein